MWKTFLFLCCTFLHKGKTQSPRCPWLDRGLPSADPVSMCPSRPGLDQLKSRSVPPGDPSTWAIACCLPGCVWLRSHTLRCPEWRLQHLFNAPRPQLTSCTALLMEFTCSSGWPLVSGASSKDLWGNLTRPHSQPSRMSLKVEDLQVCNSNFVFLFSLIVYTQGARNPDCPCRLWGAKPEDQTTGLRTQNRESQKPESPWANPHGQG